MKHTLPLLLLMCGLVACRGAPAAPPTQTPAAASATMTANPSPTPTATASPTHTVVPEDAACWQAGGQVEVHEIESQHIEDGARLRVYTPPCYAEQPERSYPVLYLFHGQTFNDEQWDRVGADEAADALIAAGEAEPFIIVMPYYPSGRQPADNPFEAAMVEEVLPWVDANLRTIPAREARAVGGLSMGGSWAIHFGLGYPEIFGALGSHSAPVFFSEAGQMRERLEETPAEELPRIWIDIGDRDLADIFASSVWFEELLTQHGIPHEWHQFTGRHEEAYWSAHMADYLRWYAEGWER